MRAYDKKKREIFSSNLKFFLETRGKTQKEVAESINTLPGTFSAWIRGEALPRPDKLTALAEYFNIAETDLLEDTRTVSLEKLSIDDLRDIFDFVRYLQHKREAAPPVESLLDAVRKVPDGSENRFMAKVAQLQEKDIAEIRRIVDFLSKTPMQDKAIVNIVDLFKELRTIEATSKQEQDDK